MNTKIIILFSCWLVGATLIASNIDVDRLSTTKQFKESNIYDFLIGSQGKVLFFNFKNYLGRRHLNKDHYIYVFTPPEKFKDKYKQLVFTMTNSGIIYDTEILNISKGIDCYGF